MPLVTVKDKDQVVVPAMVRKQAGIRVGDLLEAKVERGKVTFTPKSVIDRGIAESLEDFKRVRAYGPFETAEDMIASLHASVRKTGAGKSNRSRR